MRVWLIATLFALVLWQPAYAQQPLSQQEFGDSAMTMLGAAAPDATLERRDVLSVMVRRPNTDVPEFTVNFDNAYTEYLRNPDALTPILEHWVRFATEPRENAQMRERVVVVLRPRAMVEEFQAQVATMGATDGPPSALVWRPFAGDLVEIVVFDGAETIQYAMLHMLEEIDISPEAAWSIAPGNLPARIGQMETAPVGGAQGLAYVTGGNGLTPSALTDPRFCSMTALSSLVFLVVDRNGYIMADRREPRAWDQFVALYEQLSRNGETMSLTPIGCEGGRMRAVSLTD